MSKRQDRSHDIPFEPPRERGTWRALALAVVMHGLLLALLLHGINWQNNAPAGAEAELWTPDETQDQIQPPPQPQPAPPVVAPPPQQDDAEIALQQAKQRQEEAQRQAELAEQQRQKQLQQEADQRLEQERLAQAKLDQQKAEQQKKLQEQQLKEQQAKALQAKQQQDADADKKAAEQALKAKQAAAAQAKAKLDQARQARLNALKGMAGNSASGEGLAAAGTGNGSGGTGSAGYADKVRRKVLPNVTFGGSIDSNPEAVVTVNCAPDGTVLDARISKASSNPAWDDAVLRAVQASSPMPRDKDGSAPHNFTITFTPKPKS
jgi:colicin import membrane protein